MISLTRVSDMGVGDDSELDKKKVQELNADNDSITDGASGIIVDDNSVSANIARSKTLIQTLASTAQKSALLMNRVRSYHETRQMLDVSKKMSAFSTAQVRRAQLNGTAKGKKIPEE